MPTPISDSYISVLWRPPIRPNGPNLRYELARSKIRQPLDRELFSCAKRFIASSGFLHDTSTGTVCFRFSASANNFNTWSSIYTGSDTYFDDRGLTIFTTYQYRVTVYNDFGQVTSAASEEVTTFGGVPTKAPTVEATVVDHVTIEVTWETPSKL